jgi:hypothetical protein
MQKYQPWQPGTVFSLLCQLELHMPQGKENMIQAGADPQCESCLNATEGMNFDEHMRFFCTGASTEDVRDTHKHHQLWKNIPSLGDMCHKWLKRNPVPG